MMKLLYAALIFTLTFSSCKKKKEEDPQVPEVLYAASDFTDASFNAGIEGPCYQDGILYAVSYDHNGSIGQVNSSGVASLFVDLPSGSIGNGIVFHSDGRMLVADYIGHNVYQINMSTKDVTVYAHDATMNQPNDLAITSTDLVFCSDPKWSNNTGKIWRANADGSMTLLDGAMGTTNGIEVSNADTVLYVNESVQRNVWAYDLDATGNVSNKRLLISFPDFGMDGMCCDKEGNLYIARYGKGTVVVVSPQGTVVREIDLTGTNPTNVAFGGSDGRTCYVTLQDRGVIEAFRVEVAGKDW